ncbi:MAG: hypothetical protein AAFO63_03635 [Pseudomonadota bacterium]
MDKFRGPGVGLIISAVVFFITIAIWPLFLGAESSPETASSSASRAAHLLAEKSHYLALWTVESMTMGLLAASAFVLAFRGPAKVGSPIGWSLLGVGSLANIAMYAFVMGSYFVVATIAAENPLPYEAAKAAAYAIFNIANGLAFLGVAILLVGYCLSDERMLPRWVSIIGAVACLITFLTAFYGLLKARELMMLMAPGALLGYILLGVIGVRIVCAKE